MIYINDKILSCVNGRVIDLQYAPRLEGYVTDGGKYVPITKREITGSLLLTDNEQSMLRHHFPDRSRQWAEWTNTSPKQCPFELKITDAKGKLTMCIESCMFDYPELSIMHSDCDYQAFAFMGNCAYDVTVDDDHCGGQHDSY